MFTLENSCFMCTQAFRIVYICSYRFGCCFIKMHLYVIREQTNISTKWAKWHFTFSLFWCIYFQLKSFDWVFNAAMRRATQRKSIFKIIKWNWNKSCCCLCRVVVCIGFVNPDSLLAKIQISVYVKFDSIKCCDLSSKQLFWNARMGK